MQIHSTAIVHPKASLADDVEVGPFCVDDADDERIVPATDALPFLPMVEVDAGEAEAIRTGRKRAAPDTRTTHDGRLVAVGSVVMPV